MRARLFSDADNTLWDTDAVYASAQLGLVRDIATIVAPLPHVDIANDAAALAFVRVHDQRIAVGHVEGLRYPPLLLAQALHVAFGGGSNDVRLLNAVESYGVALRAIPELRSGVREALPKLALAIGRFNIVTETNEARCAAILTHHGLGHHVDRIVCGTKKPSLYHGLRDIDCRDIMVGDQRDRDIAYAQAAGFEGVLFTSPFTPFWTAELDVQPQCSIADFREILPFLVAPIAAVRSSVDRPAGNEALLKRCQRW